MFEKRRKEIAARRAAIRALLEGKDPVDMDALERELDDLDKEERDLDRREAATRRLNSGAGLEGRDGQQGDRGSGDEGGGSPTPGPVNPIAGSGENRSGLPVGVESRAAYLADLSAMTLPRSGGPLRKPSPRRASPIRPIPTPRTKMVSTMFLSAKPSRA